jgi:hypothetical protein
MDRKSFLRSGLQLSVALGCPCVSEAFAAETKSGPAVAPEAQPCGKVAGDYPNATTFEKRADFGKTWIGRFMKVVDERLVEPERQALMAANGRACAMGAYGPPDASKAMTVDVFLAQLQGYVGEENAHREGDIVFFNYVGNPDGLKVADGYCLCPLVEDGPKDLSPTYCHCSVGYVGYMFEKAIGRPVQVELLESLRGGGKRCRFAVRL